VRAGGLFLKRFEVDDGQLALEEFLELVGIGNCRFYIA
jgi:hypothetical protein